VAVIRLLAENSGATIAPAIADRVSIALEENPTTGYRWQPRSSTPLLAPVGEEYAPAAGGGSGGGGIRTFVYEAVGAGAGRLELELRRAWDPAAEPLSTFGVALDIGGEASSGGTQLGAG
jgi:inhibitor of cysteine peptidase